MKYVVFYMCRTNKILIPNWPRKLKFSQFLQACQLLFHFSHQGYALVTLYVPFLCSDWSKFDRWVHAENFCSILKLVYFDSWSWQSFCVNLWCFSRSFSTECTKWNSAATKSLLLFMVLCLLGFWLRNTSLVNIEWVQIVLQNTAFCPRTGW